MISSAFDGLLTLSNLPHHANNQLLHCLKIIASRLKVSAEWDDIENLNEVAFDLLENYEKQMGMKFHPSMTHSLHQLPQLDYPVLIEEKNHGNIFVILKKTGDQILIFNPASNKNELIPLTSEIIINRAWQCLPYDFPTQAGYFGLVKFTLQHYKKNIMTAMLFGVFVSTVTLIVSMLSSFVLSYWLEMNPGNPLLLFFAIFLFCSGTSGLLYANSLLVKSINTNIVFLIIPNIVNHILNLPLQITKRFLSSDLSQRISDYESSVAYVIKISLSILFNCSGCAILLAYMAFCSNKLALLYFVICTIFSAIKITWLPKSIKNLNSQLNEQSKLNTFLIETLLQIHKIRSANTESEIFNRWFHKLIRLKIFSEIATKIDMLITTLDTLLPVVLLSCLYSILYFHPNTLQSYDLIQFIVCAGQFSLLFNKLSMELVALSQFIPGLNRLDNLLSEKAEEHHRKASVIDFKHQLNLSHLYFRSHETGNYILEDVSLTIPAEKFIAVIGRSGAGKSTLFRLILGLESANSGSILIDNENMTNLNMKTVRKQFGVVLQTTNLFSGSIFSNIAINSHITIEEAWRLAALVGLDDDINNMPMKMFTYISDNTGESISGGQKQKILIARALATNPKILLLDEATSALDSQSQALIQRNLAQLNITCVVIAHRYSTIKDADMIYVMEKGKIIDSGRYQELEERKSLPGSEKSTVVMKLNNS
jgi:ABC-type bacteriocin/lantibiotic exporter with double-glycine peptidase domain